MAKGPKDDPKTDDLEAVAGKALVAAASTNEVDSALAVELSKGDLDIQIATAKQYPRSMAKAIRNVMELATQDSATAAECIYSIPRDGKLITGPSIRFAELLYQQWGNDRVAARIETVDRQAGFVEATASYHDLETNSAVRRSVRRRIKDKQGHLYSADMIVVTGNAAASIALRNAILAGIPKPIWRVAHEKCLAIVKGDEKTLGARRTALLTAFTELGFKPSQIMAIAGVVGEQDINLDKMLQLSGLYSSIKNGEVTVEEILGQMTPQTRDLAQAYAKEKPQEAPSGAAAPSAQADAPAATQAQPGPSEPQTKEEAPQPAELEPKTATKDDLDEWARRDAKQTEDAFAEAEAETEAEAEAEAEDLTKAVTLPERQYLAAMAAAASWDEVRAAARDLRQSSEWEMLKSRVREFDELAYRRTLELIGDDKTFVTASSDHQFFIWWVQFDAKPEQARPMWQKLTQWEGYANLPEKVKAGLARAMQAKEAEGADGQSRP